MWLSNQQSRIIRRAAVATPELPTISGLALWLKADGITGLSDADAIATWTDSSVNGRNATQASAPAQPLYKTGIINGLPVVRFNGTSQWLGLSSLSQSTFSAFFVVSFDYPGTDIDNYLIGGADSLFGYDDDAKGMRILSSTGNYATGLKRSEIGNQFAVVGLVDTANSCVVRINGAAQGSAITIGAAFVITRIAGYANTIRILDGDIAEIIVYDSALSDANRQAVEAYLSAKYGIALT